MADYPIAGKFVTLEDAPWMPNKCASCGHSNVGSSGDDRTTRRQFITWHMEVDFYGVIYLCMLCSRELGQAAGLPTRESYAEVANALGELLIEKSELAVRVNELEAVISAIPSLAKLLSVGGPVDSEVEPAERTDVPESPAVDGESLASAHRLIESAVDGTERDDPKPNKPVVSERPVHVSKPQLDFGL